MKKLFFKQEINYHGMYIRMETKEITKFTNPWFPQKDEIWEISWIGSDKVLTKNILAINDEFVKIAVWERYPRTREIRLDNINFIRRVG